MAGMIPALVVTFGLNLLLTRYIHRAWHWERVARLLMLSVLTGMTIIVSVVPALTQSQETTNERTKNEISSLQRELGAVQALHIESRLALAEDTFIEVKWLARLAASTLIGQLLLQVVPKRKDDRK